MSASPITSKECSTAGCQGATGSSALFLARQAVASGTVECALAVGFEQMKPGALNNSVFRHLGVVVDPELSCEIRHVGAGWLAGC